MHRAKTQRCEGLVNFEVLDLGFRVIWRGALGRAEVRAPVVGDWEFLGKSCE